MKSSEKSDPKSLDEFLTPQIASGWGISKLFFSTSSWSILTRALTHAELIPKKTNIDVITMENLSKITIEDVENLKHIGETRIQVLITELQNVSEFISEDYVQKESLEVRNKLNLESDLAFRIIKSENWREEFEDEFGYSFEYVEFDDETTIRNLNVLAYRASGLTLDELGKTYAVSRERIRQILDRIILKISKNMDLTVENLNSLLDTRLAANKNAHKIAEIKTQLEIEFKTRLIVDKKPGIKIEELAELMGISENLLNSILQKQTKKFIYSEQNLNANKSNYSDEAILEALRMTKKYMSPITRTHYDDLVEKGLINGPGSQTVMKRFRTWNKACEAANIAYTDSARDIYESLWTREEMLSAVIDFLKNPIYGKSVQSYDQWRVGSSSNAPSGTHIRNNFNTWMNAKNEALIKMQKEKISPNLLNQ
jgi:AraC-like DNA-binding protein